MVIYGYNFYSERQKQKEIFHELMDSIEDTFVPFVESVSFTVNDMGTYVLALNSMDFTGDYASTSGVIVMELDVYEEKVEERYKLDYYPTPKLFIDVARMDTNSEYELSPTHISQLSKLMDAFTVFLYDYHFEKNNVHYWEEQSSTSTINEDDVELNTYGMVVNEGMVKYMKSITAVNQRMAIDTQFMAKLPGEKMIIPLTIDFPEEWKKN
ncbi:MAG: hypothetical protein LRY73_12115 [Bacillus sp. (in: Bacteria)]|nr:hypothetical protein [Bacillus sp. (in: firmicutes)]